MIIPVSVRRNGPYGFPRRRGLGFRGLGGAACLSASQLYQLALSAGFSSSDAVTAAAVAMGESGGCPGAYNGGNPPGAESSYGLWQINIKANPSFASSNLYDPATNAAAAFTLFSAGGWGLWGAYTNGSYLAYLPAAAAAAGSGVLAASTAGVSDALSSIVAAVDPGMSVDTSDNSGLYWALGGLLFLAVVL